MRKNFNFIVIAILAGGLSLSSCKKKEKETDPVVKQNDQTGSVAADGAIDDVNDYISNNIGGGSNKSARVAAYNLPCGIVSVKIDSSGTGSAKKKAYTMVYGSQTPCGYKRKSGQVAFQLSKGNRFDSIGAVFTVSYIDYKVEALASGDVVTLNGKLYVTNTSGGFVWQSVLESKTIEHSIRGTLTVTYGNNQTRQRNYFQHRTWSSTNGWAGLSFTVAGDTTIKGIKVSETGQTYEGNYSYQTQLLTSFTWTNCSTTYAGPYVLKTGIARMDVAIPAVTPAYFQIDAGYYQDISSSSSIPQPMNDCSSNAYKITLQVGTSTTTEYQLY